MEHEYIIQTAAANMPNSCWGTYRRVAVLKVVKGTQPKMISERARGVLEIVCTWEKLHTGKGIRDAYSRALKEAEALCKELNNVGA